MIIEYAGVADRWAGDGVVHNVRAWWNVNETVQGAVKRAAVRAVRDALEDPGHVAVIGMDTCTYGTPQLNALVRVRVRTHEEVAHRAELLTRRYPCCVGCVGPGAGYLVRMHADGAERALCFTCWDPVRGACKVLHWIKADGRLQL
jgi:hypothetical protein